MSSTCITSLDLCNVRVAKLTSGGVPSPGATHGYNSDAAVSLQVSVETEAGDDKTLKNGCGNLMAVLRTPDKIKSLKLALVLCQLDAELIQLLTGAALFFDGADVIGSQMPAVGSSPDPVCFEGWSKAWDNDNQLVSPFTTPNATYIHWVFPFNRWVQGNFTLENQLMTIPVNGVGSENSNITANGPFNDWPPEVAGPGGITRLGGWFYDGVIPAATCTYVTVPTTS